MGDRQQCIDHTLYSSHYPTAACQHVVLARAHAAGASLSGGGGSPGGRLATIILGTSILREVSKRAHILPKIAVGSELTP